jgi:hypothetical protein
MPEIQNVPPATIQAGDTITWRRELVDYPAGDGWSLKYTLVSTNGVKNIEASSAGDDYTVTVTAATSKDYVAGDYVLTEYVTKDDERHTIGTSRMRVLPDLAAASGATDTRTHARKVLDAIEAWLERRAPTAATYRVGERELQTYPLPELLSLRDRYRAEVTREERIASGRVFGRVFSRC